MTEWIFSGIGTELIVTFITLAIGGYGCYKRFVSQKTNQRQSSDQSSTQLQIGNIYQNKNKLTINQNQISRENSIQIQIGNFNAKQ